MPRRRWLGTFTVNTGKIGMGLGITSLLGRWMTGTTHLTSTEILVRYGLAGSLGYMIAGALGLILFGFVGRRIRSELPEGSTLGDYLLFKLGNRVSLYMVSVLLLLTIQVLLIQCITAAILAKAGFGIPFVIAGIIFISFSFLMVKLGGDIWIQRLSLFTVFLTFVTVILLPLYFFIKHGVENVYLGIRLYHTYMLVLDNQDSYLFMLTGILVAFAQICCDPATWQRMLTIERQKVLATFVISGAVWTTVEMALILLVGIALHTGGFTDDDSLLQHLTAQVGTPILLVLMYVCLLSNAMTSFSTAMSGALNLVARMTKKKRRNSGLLIWILPILLAAVLCVFIVFWQNRFSILDLIFAFGLLSAVLFVPVLYVVFVKKPCSIDILLAFFIGLAAGSFIYMRQDPMLGIWTGAIVAAILLVACSGIRRMNRSRPQ